MVPSLIFKKIEKLIIFYFYFFKKIQINNTKNFKSTFFKTKKKILFFFVARITNKHTYLLMCNCDFQIHDADAPWHHPSCEFQRMRIQNIDINKIVMYLAGTMPFLQKQRRPSPFLLRKLIAMNKNKSRRCNRTRRGNQNFEL